MAKYTCIDGIVLTKICDVNFLIPTRKASEITPVISSLSPIGAISWQAFQKGGIESLAKLHAGLLNKSEEEAYPRITRFLDAMAEKGYLVKSEE